MTNEADLGIQDDGGPRIDLTHDVDVAFWCRVFDVDHGELRRAVQHVGPRAQAVLRYLRQPLADRSAVPDHRFEHELFNGLGKRH
jgi:hypothetical protein